ncbi:MAG: ribosome silencing factor [Acidimicrobiaceae bacterium]|nr:ribosome silencing factor [Acidimicrobiaceae bacterium]MDE0606466.1 ribosome silencing factor [Acidimicrobiaceae bacterium]
MSEGAEDHLKWVRRAAVAADDKKAIDTLIIDVGDVLTVTDHFVITSAANSRQVNAVCDAVEEEIRVAGGPSPVRVEGLQEREWVLMDYGAFVVHVFRSDQREFYQLERLWGDRPRVDWTAPIPSGPE